MLPPLKGRGYRIIYEASRIRKGNGHKAVKLSGTAEDRPFVSEIEAKGCFVVLPVAGA